MTTQPPTDSTEQSASAFKPMPLILVVLGIFLLISFWTNSYTEENSLHRYCDISDETMEYLYKVLTEKEPAGDQPRRPYLIAAKLIFLIPQQSGETLENYIPRVKSTIDQQCN